MEKLANLKLVENTKSGTMILKESGAITQEKATVLKNANFRKS